MNNAEKQSRIIKSHGGKRPGAGRPAGSHNKLTRPLREAAALESEACLETLVYLRNHGESEQVRLAAANSILDRAHGRPRQEIDIKDDSVTVLIAPVPQIEDGRTIVDRAEGVLEAHVGEELLTRKRLQ